MTENNEQSDAVNPSAHMVDAKPEAAGETQEAASPAGRRRMSAVRVLKAIAYRVYRLSLETAGVVGTLAFAWLCGINILIAQRVMDVSFVKGDASRWFANAFDGQSADVEKMTLAWEAADNTIIFRAKNISVKSKSGEPLNALAYVETELALRDVARGTFDPIRVAIDGGELSFVRDAEGNFVAGLGTPETVGELGPVWRGEKNDGDNDLEIGRIKSLNIENAKIHIRDKGSDYAAQLSDSRLAVDILPDTIVFDMAANLSRNGGDEKADVSPLGFKGRVSPDLQIVDAIFTGQQLNPSKQLPRLPVLNPIVDLNALSGH